MKKTLIPLSIVGILLTGCVNNVLQPTTPVKFYTPSKLSVIKEGSSIYIKNIHSNNYNSSSLVKDIKSYFKKDGIFNIVSNIKSADVIISLNTFYSYRRDNSSDTKYNKEFMVKTKVYRDRKGRETGGQDSIVMTNTSASTATLITTISIYNKKTLQPLAYFDISPVNTSTVVLGKSTTSYKSNKAFNKELTKNVINKLNDLVTTKNKNINVFMPNNDNKILRKLLLSAKFKELFSEAKAILPKFKLSDISVEKYKNLNAKASIKGSTIQKRDIEQDLSNFYLYYMAKESTDISSKNIKDVFNAYKKIMFLTQNEELSLACANSLGRIEFKADRLKIDLGEN